MPTPPSVTPSRVYVETTVVSYLTARPSVNPVVAGHQQTTHEWWGRSRAGFELFTSQLVLDEAGGGDPEAALERLAILHPADPVPVNMELPAHGQRDHAARDRSGLCRERVQGADHLHPRGIGEGRL